MGLKVSKVGFLTTHSRILGRVRVNEGLWVSRVSFGSNHNSTRPGLRYLFSKVSKGLRSCKE